jgi:hypothetical protein
VVSSRAADLLASPIGLQLLSLIDTLGDENLSVVFSRLRIEYSRYRGDYEDYVARLRSEAAGLAKLAHRISVERASWWQPLDPRAQVWASPAPAEPREKEFAVDLQPMQPEAPKPLHALWTSTLGRDLVSPWLEHPENFRQVNRIWRLTVTPGVRVAEIHSAADWWRLTTSNRGQEPGHVFNVRAQNAGPFARMDPNWTRIAEDWDGVHLSIGGYLTAEDVTYEKDGVTTELRGWNMESTVWLRWVFDSFELIR